tara:strand:- start:120 stop:2042 length:1923 start_codon:yes stop_codon:yes gene_type:complete
MAEKKLTTRELIIDLESLRKQGIDKNGIKQYLSEQKVSRAEAEKILDFINQPKGANVMRQALGQGAALGFGDEIEGTLRGLLPGTTRDKEIDLARQRIKMYEDNFPGQALTATLGGGLLTGGVGAARAAALRGAPLAQRALQGLKTGGLYGTVGGAGQAEGDIADRFFPALMGGATGGVVGGAVPVAAAGGRALMDAASGLRSGAARSVAERNVREAADYDEVTPDVAREAFKDAPDVMVGADVAEPRAMALRNAVRLAANQRGGVQGLRFLGDRADAQGSRVTKALEPGLPSTSLDEFLDETNELRRLSANENYSKFYENPVQLDQKLKSYFEDEDFEEAYKLAKTVARREGVVLPPLFEVVDGNKVFAQPNARMLDYIKQGMDALVDRTYKLEGGTLGKSLQKVRDQYRDHLDEIMPDYPKARSEYAGLSASMEAAELGEKFILNPRKISKNIFKRLGDPGSHEREAFKVGVAEAIRMKINTSPDGSNIVKKIFGSPDSRERLRIAFDDDVAFDAFESQMRKESMMRATADRALNVSSTAPMQAEQASMGRIIGQAGETLNSPLTALARAGVAMSGGPATDDIARETRELLISPENRARLLQVLATGNPRLRNLSNRVTPTVGNVLAGQSPRINPFIP